MSMSEAAAKPLPEELQRFISDQTWTFAKTYAETYPHEYIVEGRVDAELYKQLADHIDTHGYREYFYKKPVIYFDHEGYTYWHMENIINRCVVADTYHRRKQDGRLPRRPACPQVFEYNAFFTGGPDLIKESPLPFTLRRSGHNDVIAKFIELRL